MGKIVIITMLSVASTAFGNIGDSWVLPAIVHGGNLTVYPGEGGDGTPAYDVTAPAQVYWMTAGTTMPTTTELYEIWYYQPAVGNHSWQVIESQIGGTSAEQYPIDPRIPWVGQDGVSHQYGGAFGGTPGQWNLIEDGPHLPFPHQMWLIGGTSGLYSDWSGSSWPVSGTVGALKLVQVTPEPTTALFVLLGLPLLRRGHKRD